MATFSAVSRAERQRNLVMGVTEVRCKPEKKPSKSHPQIVLRENSYMLEMLTSGSSPLSSATCTIILNDAFSSFPAQDALVVSGGYVCTHSFRLADWVHE